MSNDKKEFVDINGVETFAKKFFEKVDDLIDGRIIKTEDFVLSEKNNNEGENENE